MPDGERGGLRFRPLRPERTSHEQEFTIGLKHLPKLVEYFNGKCCKWIGTPPVADRYSTGPASHSAESFLNHRYCPAAARSTVPTVRAASSQVNFFLRLFFLQPAAKLELPHFAGNSEENMRLETLVTVVGTSLALAGHAHAAIRQRHDEEEDVDP